MTKTLKTLGLVSIVASSLIADIDIEFDPMLNDGVVPGKRILVQANINDPAGLNTVRTYFKSTDAANYSFVPMGCESNVCTAVLPAVSEGTKGINYLVLVKNGENKVYKTQTLDAQTLAPDADVPDYQNVPSEGTIQVKTELAKAPKMVQGFSDNMALDTVDSTLRYGVVAGLGSGSSAGGAAAAASATGTTSAGTIAAGAAGISTTAIAAGAVVVAGGAAAAGGGSGGGGGGSSEACVTLEGEWDNYGAQIYGCSNIYLGKATFNYSNGQYSGISYEVSIDPHTCTIDSSSTEPFTLTSANKCTTQEEFSKAVSGSISVYKTNEIVYGTDNYRIRMTR